MTPVRLADGGVALESNFRQGVKHEVLRSLCQLVNTTKLALEVGRLACAYICSVMSRARGGCELLPCHQHVQGWGGGWFALCIFLGMCPEQGKRWRCGTFWLTPASWRWR